MPTYEYHCKACDHEFEEVQRITEDPIQKCPSCGKKKVRRLISNTSFVLKGGGWYDDGYHGNGGKTEKEGKANGSAAADASKSSSKKSDSSKESSKKSDSSQSSSQSSSKKSDSKKAGTKK